MLGSPTSMDEKQARVSQCFAQRPQPLTQEILHWNIWLATHWLHSNTLENFIHPWIHLDGFVTVVYMPVKSSVIYAVQGKFREFFTCIFRSRYFYSITHCTIRLIHASITNITFQLLELFLTIIFLTFPGCYFDERRYSCKLDYRGSTVNKY